VRGSIYHIYNRGNNKELVFRDEQDYRAFLFRIGLALGLEKDSLTNSEVTRSPKSRIRIKESPADLFRLHSFCLMPNHYHLLMEQRTDVPISKLISKVCTSFSKFINLKYKRIGHLFQDEFKAVPIESNSQLMLFSSYIHMNPVKDRVVNKPGEYIWSSYKDYTGVRDNPLIYKNFMISLFGSPNNFIRETTALYNKSNLAMVPFDMLIDIS
jgi:putative transposase